jgi:hypothetical protein
MKQCFLILIFFLSACTSLQNFQEQPVVALPNNSYKTTCNGMAEGWDSCDRKAKRTCPNDYIVMDRIQTGDFVHRELSFSCK